METAFTPLESLFGGVLIGAAAVLLMGFYGRIFGATGLLAGILSPSSQKDFVWRAVLIVGMICAPVLIWLFTGAMPVIQAPSHLEIAVGGLIVGVGVTFGGGCTSGHGVCGLARFSKRSLVATLTFMATAVVAVFVMRHVIGGAA